MFGQPVSAFDSNLALKERIGVQLQKSSFSQRLKVAEIVKLTTQLVLECCDGVHWHQRIVV